MTYTEAARKSRELVERYIQKLLGFGYQDVDIQVPISSNRDPNRSDAYVLELRRVSGFFWHEECGFNLEIGLCGGYYAPDNIVEIFDDIIEFIGDATVLSRINIGKEFLEHARNKGFTDINVGQFTDEKRARLIAFKENIKYSFDLHRRWPEEQTISDEDDDPIEFGADEIDTYTKKVKKLFKNRAGTDSYQIQLSSDLTKLSAAIRQDWDEHYLTVRLCNSDLTWEEDVFYNIIGYWLDAAYNQNCFLANLHDDCFHVHHISSNQGCFVAYKEGCKYEIEVSSKRIIDFDHMEGHIFEHFCAETLSLNGFNNVQVTQGSGDQGIDIIAYKDDIKYGIQCKCYSSDIGNKAVQEVYAGKSYYNCDVGVVLTNRYFTKSAIELARKSRVHLWDRQKLLELVENCKDRILGKYGK